MSVLWLISERTQKRTMSSPSSAKKRRVDTSTISSGRRSVDTTPKASVSDGSGRATGIVAAVPKGAESHVVLTSGLSPELWGKILDFLFYSDLRSVLAVCRGMALVASKYVNVLHITRPSQLNVVAARRFPNVTRMGVFCLVTCIIGQPGEF